MEQTNASRGAGGQVGTLGILHKTLQYQYTLQPTSQQERALEEVRWRCRTLYTTALEQRLTCSCAEVPTQPLSPTGRETGIDVALKTFRITAEGAAVANPRYHRQAEQALAKAQKRLSRRKKGSK